MALKNSKPNTGWRKKMSHFDGEGGASLGSLLPFLLPASLLGLREPTLCIVSAGGGEGKMSSIWSGVRLASVHTSFS